MLICLLAGVGTAWADTVTFSYEDYKGQGTSSTGSAYTMDDKTYVSLGESKFYGNTGYAQFYAGGIITVTPKSGASVTKVAITTTSTSYNGYQSSGKYTASTGSVAKNTSNAAIVEWTGTASTAFTIDHDKQIRWTSIEVTYTTSGGGSTPTTYSVNVAKNIENGTVTASPTSAAEGATVTLTATPDAGYEFGSWSITNASTSAAISVKDNKFTMPAANVNVSATFNEEQSSDAETASFIFNTDAGLSALGIAKPNSGAGTNLGSTKYTSGAISMTATNGGTATRVWNSSGTTSLRVYKTGGSLTFSGATITKIAFNSSVAMKANVGTLSGATWEGSASSVTFTATDNVTISTIAVTYTAGSEGGAPQITNFIKTSTLNLEVGAGNYDVRECLNIPADYDQSAYAITTAIDGLTEKDGEFACVYPYLAFKKAGTYTVTVTAAAVPGKYAETKGNITVTVTGGTTPEPTVYESLAALVAAGTPTTDGRNVTVTLTDEVITGIHTTSGNRNGIFLQVGNQEIELYCKNVPETWEVGGTVSGTLYKCPWKLYNTTWELCPESWGLLVYTAPTLQKLTITGEPKKEYYVGDSFDVEGLTVTAKYTSGTTLDVTDKVEWMCDPETFTEEGNAIQVYVVAGLGKTTADNTYTVSVAKNPYVIADNFTAIKGNIDENISYEAFQGGAGTPPAIPTNTKYIRLYQSGGYITISGAKGVTISEVILTTGSTYNATTIGYAVDDEDAPTEGTAVAKESDFKASGLNCSSISFYCLSTDNKARLDIAAIKVKYTKVDINLTSISVAGEGIDKEFLQNTRYSREGITVTANYSDDSTADVTKNAVFSEPDMTTAGKQTIEVTYTEGGVTKTTTYTINVIAESVISIKASDAPYAFVLNDEFNEGDLVVKADYNSGNKDVVLGADLYRVVAPDMTTLGKKTVRVELKDNSEIYTEYAIYVLPTNTLFFESFDTNDGTGGNDGQWNGPIASNKIKSDNTWEFTSAAGANQCAKFGTGDAAGSAVTPALGHAGSVTVSFKAGAWGNDKEQTTIKVSIDGDDSSAQTVTLTKGEWNEYTVTLTGLTPESKVKFAALQASNNRFFLDEVLITEATVSSVTNYIEALKNGKAGYTIDGLQKVVNGILQITE